MIMFFCVCMCLVPDVSQLDDELVRLLAQQRIKQLFTDKKIFPETLSHGGHVTTGSAKHCNHVTRRSTQQLPRISKHRQAGLSVCLSICCYE